MKKLLQYLKELGCTSAKQVNGPNGMFISYTIGDEQLTLPVGKKSQNGILADDDFNVLITEDGQPIATVNVYSNVSAVEFE